jgi:hypothetical protein
MNDKMDGHFRKLEGIYSTELIQVIRWSLMTDPLERPQSVFALQKALREPAQQIEESGDMMESMSRKLRGFFGGISRRMHHSTTTIQENSH